MEGISIGSTWSDTSCDLRYDAEALRQAGQPLAAIARLCQKPEIASAMSVAGTPCPGQTPSKIAYVAPISSGSTDASSTGYAGTDPIVRRRLGLPELIHPLGSSPLRRDFFVTVEEKSSLG